MAEDLTTADNQFEFKVNSGSEFAILVLKQTVIELAILVLKQTVLKQILY